MHISFRPSLVCSINAANVTVTPRDNPSLARYARSAGFRAWGFAVLSGTVSRIILKTEKSPKPPECPPQGAAPEPPREASLPQLWPGAKVGGQLPGQNHL